MENQMTTAEETQIREILKDDFYGVDHYLPLLRDADFGDVVKWVREAVDGGMGVGMFRCEHCGVVCEDPAHPSAMEGCALLNDESGTDTICLCNECHDAAVAARAKIVVNDFEDDDGNEFVEEDDSALTDDERSLAAFLDKASKGSSRQARDIIGMYPRDERRDLHRYQDQIDADEIVQAKSLNERFLAMHSSSQR